MGEVTTTTTKIQETAPATRGGVAYIKAEYLIDPVGSAGYSLSKPLEASSSHLDADDAAEGRSDSGHDAKRRKTGWKGRTTGPKTARQGEAAVKICKAWEATGECSRGEGCNYAHSWAGYFDVKPRDTHHELGAPLASVSPFVRARQRIPGGEDVIGVTLDLATECPVLADLGFCPFGWRCRFLGNHIRRAETEAPEGRTRIGSWELLANEEILSDNQKIKFNESNWPNMDVLKALKTNKYDWSFTGGYLARIEPEKPFALAQPKSRGKVRAAPVIVDEESAMNGITEEDAMNTSADKCNIDGESEAMDVPLRPEEKRRLNWEDGLYLAPLTTVGNLPFRRLCTGYGATITISEMALAQQIVTGQSEEWALVRRHSSEKTFGVQLAGGYANRMVPAAEVISRELGASGVDFVDVNMGCPIDLLFNQGAGSALMDAPGRLGKILVGMNRALGEIPLTVKFRMGVSSNKPNAHKLIPRFATEWGASAMTLHGRSRQQRYSKLADWGYIRQCVSVLRDSVADAGLPPVPIFGNGDCYSAQSYYDEKEKSGVDGIMIARGALIKPWIFTEIAERREWDISATERLEGIRKFAEYGLSHWGSDTLGVNLTRRFLCEALSFQHRYVPLGLLERMPPMLNERPPAYRGRNELETLLSSPLSSDWVKISEMFLGPVDNSFTFAPKHKSSAFGNEEAQG